jgi:hypothetical protein
VRLTLARLTAALDSAVEDDISEELALLIAARAHSSPETGMLVSGVSMV